MEASRSPAHLLKSCLAFIAMFSALQWAWSEARDSRLEHLVIHDMTVLPATFIINRITPEADAVAAGSRIQSKGGGLNILNGCDGVDVALLLCCAFLVVGLPWRKRLIGLGIGLVVVFALNQARIVALFYAFRTQRSLFDALHTLVLPTVMIIAVALYFYAFLRRG